MRSATALDLPVSCRYIEEMLGLAHLAAVGRWRRRMAAIGLCTLLCSNCGIPWSKQRIVRVISLGLKAVSEASQFQVRRRAVFDTLHARYFFGLRACQMSSDQVGNSHRVICG